MPQYRYKGRNDKGELVSGQLEGESGDSVARQLMNTGITPVDIQAHEEKPSTDVGALMRRQIGFQKVRLTDLQLFCRQMYSLTRSGVPITRGLRSLAASATNPLLQRVIGELVESLESGRDLAGSMARHPDVFPPVLISIVRVGEDSGRLEESFQRLYEYFTLEKKTGQQIKGALRYPLIVLVAMAVAVGVLVMVVIPAFSSVFAQFGAELPLPTRIILAVSDFASTYWYVVLGGVAALVIGLRAWVRTEKGRYRWDRAKFRIPVVGSIVLRGTLARFARTFAMSYRSGVPLLQALNLVSRAVDNEYVAERVLQMRNGVERGESLSRTATTTGLFTPLVLQMLAVGEETGAVDDMLDEVAEFYEQEVAYELENISASIEPILIVVMGGLVLVLALGVFLPMWDLARVAF